MKIIEGKLAGKVINYKENKGTRVTSEKVRKAVFDVLKNLIYIEGANVADIFCGSGMYGLEALSRGAGGTTFVDESKNIIDGLKRNIKILDIGSTDTKIVNKKFESFIKTCDEKFDLVFVDPPYYKFDFKKLNDLYIILNKNGTIVLESSKRIKIGELQGLEKILEKKYGDTIVYFYKNGKL